MKFTTTLILATFGLSATSASSGGGGVRGGSNFYEAAADGDFENIPNPNNNGNNGHGNRFNTICRAISCDDPCGNTTDTQTYFVDVCDKVEMVLYHLQCDDGYKCQGCAGEGMPNAYYCKLEEESLTVDTTEQ
jgi:hypothetical protein